ncbi:hypothetical protein VXE06_16430 [Klebsiella oxytoca]|uniref:hypothetical protein n=1 Tax=Klebsiella oxytoca TaxID=571 RepID=UPI0030CBDBDC
MAKNSVDAYGASGKSNVLFFEPEKLYLVTDKAHPLYDERIHLPINEAMVLNIMDQGVLEPIIIWKDPESGMTCVVDGRQRVRHTLEANKHLVKSGESPLLVPAVAKRGSAVRMALAAMDSEPHPDDELSNLLWYSQEATCHSDPNYYCEFQRLATPGFIAGIILELQERRKADSELAIIIGDDGGDALAYRRLIQSFSPGTKLYRHAQPAPVVPDEMAITEDMNLYQKTSPRVITPAAPPYSRLATLR